MEFIDLFDKETLDAILADAKEAGIKASEVKKVLNTIPNGGKAEPTRGMSTESELMELMGEDKDAAIANAAAASGVERGKTGTILMLAAPFILKYLLSNNSNSSQNSSLGLLGSLLGGGMAQPVQQQPSGLGLLGSLFGGGMAQPVQQQSLTSSLLGSMLGASQPAYATNNTASLLGSLLGGSAQPQYSQANSMGSLLNLMGGATQQQAAQQPVTQQTQAAGLGSLLNLTSGAPEPVQPVQQSQSSGGGLLDALFNLLGDNGK